MELTRVYIHYPFCRKLCHYCNFAAGTPPISEFTTPYHHALLTELRYYKQLYDFNTITNDSLYLGGGTPSLMPQKHMEELFSYFTFLPNTEITLEINPETVTKEKARFWKELGINRVSLGWQSMNPETLKFLGRTSTNIDNINSFVILREEGFDNISVDRILSVTNDTNDDFYDTITKYCPDHISTYQLSIEKKTVLNFWTNNSLYHPVSDEKALLIEQETEQKLKELGFTRYETSNYHKNGKIGNHNSAYWNYNHWLGLGGGATGFIPNHDYGLRYHNYFSFKEYIKSPTVPESQENINQLIALKEALMLGIRKRSGINKQKFEQKFNISWKDIFPNYNNPNYFEENEFYLILKEDAIPFTNPAILSLWDNLKL